MLNTHVRCGWPNTGVSVNSKYPPQKYTHMKNDSKNNSFPFRSICWKFSMSIFRKISFLNATNSQFLLFCTSAQCRGVLASCIAHLRFAIISYELINPCSESRVSQSPSRSPSLAHLVHINVPTVKNGDILSVAKIKYQN